MAEKLEISRDIAAPPEAVYAAISDVTRMAYFVQNVQSAKDAVDGEVKAAQSVGYKFVYNRVLEPTEANFSSDVVNMATPSGRIPVPASSTRWWPLSSCTATHDVFPP